MDHPPEMLQFDPKKIKEDLGVHYTRMGKRVIELQTHQDPETWGNLVLTLEGVLSNSEGLTWDQCTQIRNLLEKTSPRDWVDSKNCPNPAIRPNHVCALMIVDLRYIQCSEPSPTDCDGCNAVAKSIGLAKATDDPQRFFETALEKHSLSDCKRVIFWIGKNAHRNPGDVGTHLSEDLYALLAKYGLGFWKSCGEQDEATR